MNAIRGILTGFLLVVVILAVAGWPWAEHLPAPKMAAARIVLVLTAASALLGCGYIWSVKPGKSS
jgi:hypothetical protein